MNIVDRIREPKPAVDHRAICLTKEWFASEREARHGWLHGVYQCPTCGGWHKTKKPMQEQSNG